MSIPPNNSFDVNKDKISRLRLTIILTALGMVLEFVGGVLSNSLALISDAWHMLTHIFALGMSYFAILLSMRPATKKLTYGFYRAEILAAFVNGIILIFISGYLIYEALLRYVSPERVNAGEMLLIAGIGLAINGASTFLLVRVKGSDLNIRGAVLHEIGDMLSSVAVVAAGLAIFFTKAYILDPALSFFICILIVIWALKLLIDSGNVLLEATPKHLDIDEVVRVLKTELKGIYEVTHIHAWTIASSMYALTAHVIIADCQVSHANELLDQINDLVKKRFHIEHTNIQFECLARED